MTDDMITKPTIETILEKIVVFEARFEQRFDQLEKKIDERFEKLENEIDLLSRVASSTKAHMSELRLEFREWRTQLKEALPTPQSH